MRIQFGIAAICLAGIAMQISPAESRTVGTVGTVALHVGDSGRISLVRGRGVQVPLLVLPSGDGNLATIAGSVTWSTQRLRFDSVRSGAFGTLTSNAAGAPSGSITLSATRITGQTARDTIATLYFTASPAVGPQVDGAITGSADVRFSASAATDGAGASVLSTFRTRRLDVCVVRGVFGDANDDDMVNIIDAQQMARRAVGLPIANDSAAAQRGDVTADGTVNIVDAQQTARFAVELAVPAAPRLGAPAFRAPTVAALNLTPGGSAQVRALRTLQMSAAAVDAGGTNVTSCVDVHWATGDATRATVNPDGMVTGIAPGATTVAVTAQSTTANSPLTVLNPPTGIIVLSAPTGWVTIGGDMPLAAQVQDSTGAVNAGATVAWQSSAPTVGTVSTGGVVAGVAAGSITVTATSGAAVGTFALDILSSYPLFVSPTEPGAYQAGAFDHDRDVSAARTAAPMVWWGARLPKTYAGHGGLDLSGPVNSPIRAVADGKVSFAGISTCDDAQMVFVVHTLPNGERIGSQYVHMNRTDVVTGDSVVSGQPIGLLGNTGSPRCSSGPHLHFGTYRIPRGATPPASEAQMGTFNSFDPNGWTGPGDDLLASFPGGSRSVKLWKPVVGLQPFWGGRRVMNPEPGDNIPIDLTAWRVTGERDDLTPNNEFIEITIDTAFAGVTFDLTGWSVTANGTGDVYAFPSGFTLNAARRTVRIYTGSGTNSPTELYWGRTSGVYSDVGGDCVIIRSPGGGYTLGRCW